MRLVVIALAIASVVSLVGTPLLIKLLARRGYAQAIRVSSEGESYPDHEAKRGLRPWAAPRSCLWSSSVISAPT